MDGQATASELLQMLQPQCSEDEANCLAAATSRRYHILLFNRVQFLPRQQRPAYVVSASSFGLPFPLEALRSRFRTSPFTITTGRVGGPRATCQPVALPRCSGSSLPRVPLGPFGSPAPGLYSRREGTGSGRTLRDMPRAQSDDINQCGINLDISQLSKTFPSRRHRIFTVNDEKTAFLPQVAVTKSIRPLWGNPVPRTERHHPSFCSGFALPSSCPNARPRRWQQDEMTDNSRPIYSTSPHASRHHEA